MKRRAFLSGAAALVAGPAGAAPLPLIDPPQPLLSPPIFDDRGRRLTLADFRGHFVLLNVWATWCPPCRTEMPRLDALQSAIGGPKFQVVALSIDDGGLKNVRRFYKEIGIRNLGSYVADQLRTFLALAVVGLPTTLLVDPKGREAGRLLGPAEWDRPEFQSEFSTLVANWKA